MVDGNNEPALNGPSLKSPSMDFNGFSIPELPRGKCIRLCLQGPWADPRFMGLNAIEIFASNGSRASVEKIGTDAVEQFGQLDNLLHLSCRSTDPAEMWMCRFEESQLPININLDLKEETTVAMIRVWNYNENRVHSLRGVRNMRIYLNEECIFKGEINCAFSDLDGKPMGDTILFTTNEDILNAIAENDIFLTSAEELKSLGSQMDLLSVEPSTSTNASPSPSPLTDASIQRPMTGNASLASSASEPNLKELSGALKAGELDDRSLTHSEDEEDDGASENCVRGKLFHMELLANWGFPDAIGLTGLQFLGRDGAPLPADACTVRCSAAAAEAEARRLLNGRNLTCRPEDMWLTRLEAGRPPPTLSFHFAQEVELAGLSLWNFNASQELACAGVRGVQLYMNGRPVGGAVLLRKAPGYVFFDYVQDVMFDRCHLFPPLAARPHTNSISAFIFQIRLLSSWGDEFYIGLNGIELYNRRNHIIKLRPQNLAAFPESVNILPTVERDPRSSDKLIDGVNDTSRPQHMWLTPALPNSYARVFVIFDTPTFISRIRIFNYRKTPIRGVRHVAISADDLIIYSGEVPISTSNETGVLDVSLRELEE